MDNIDGNPSQGGEPAMEAGDWRSQLPAASRQRIINKIMETLTRHLPFSGQEGLRGIKIIAVRFEDKIYAAATSQSDYLRKISLKMLTMESNPQNTMTNSAGSSVVQPQVTNEGQLLSENVQSNILPAGAQFSAGLSCAQAATPALNMSALLSALPPSPGTDMPASTSSALPSPMDINMSSSTSELPAYGLIQSQPAQMQQQMRMLLQSNLLQRDMLQRIQESGHVSGSMLQTPNVMEQQQRLYQTQIALPETSSTSLGSTAQTELTDGADWQEEAYQKIKVMKEMYYPELSEMDQKIAAKLHHNDSLPQQPKSEQLDKLKMFKAMLERLMTVLQLSKSNISPGLKDKLGLYEKQIINFINTNKSRRPASLQAGQLPPPHMQSIEHSQSEVSLMESPANQMNPQLQSMKLQSSVPTMQLNNVTSLQQNYVSSLSGVSTAQQNMMNPLQPSSNMNPGQGTSLNSLQQVTVGSIQQTPVSAPQQANTNALPSQNGINMLQNNINPLQSNPGILRSQHLKQQEQQLYQNQLKQQYQQRQMQQQLMQKQQIIQQQQQQQQLQQQAKQQLPGQLQGQMPQLHQISDVNDVKIRPGMGVKPGTFQQHMSVGQRAYPHPHPQLKSVSPYPVTSSNQPLQSQSPQLSQHSSPQVDQQLLVPKAGTPLQNDSSSFVIPSPSTPIAPSPMSGESEKPSSLSNAGNVGHQPTAGVGAQVQSLAIGTPGISASPLLAEFIGPDGTHANAVSTMSGKSSVTEQPFERLIKAVSKASSIKAVGSIQETPGRGSQQANMNAFTSESRINMLQNNIIPVQTNAGFLQQQQQLKLMILQSQQRHLQEQLMQKNQISQQKRQQEIQQLLRKVEPELPQVNVVNDMNTSVLLSSQSGSDMNQGSIDSLVSSSGMVGKQHQKQEQEEKLFQNQVKQPYQQPQMQQQWTQKPQMLQEKQQKQIQQLQQQAKQQLHHIYFIYILFLTILLGAYLFRADY